ncbi:MAG TPA: type II secretion system inner membrane protein GspF [Desulfomonilia bacterium]
MPLFSWTGYTDKGKTEKGMLDAASLREAKVKLKAMGLFVSSINEEAPVGAVQTGTANIRDILGKVKKEDVAIVTRQLSTLIGASVPLVEALSALYDQTDNPTLKKTMAQVRDAVNEGSGFADALAQHKKIFPDLYVNMVRSGEASGALDIVLDRLADFLEGQRKLMAKVQSAMIYPVLLLFVAVGIVFFLLTTIVPKVVSMFESMHQNLPLPTKVLILISSFLGKTWWIIILLFVAAMFLLNRWKKTETGALKFDKFKMRMPLFGAVFVKVSVARFARTLGTLLTAGVPIVEAMTIVKTIVQNKVMEAYLSEATNDIIEGSTLAAPLRRSGIFPSMVYHMIEVGERSGTLEEMLIKAADAYEDDIETTVAGLTSVLEPVMIIFMAFIVGFIIISVLLPMIQMSTAIK